MIFTGITVFGTAAAYIGSLFDHGNIFGIWGILLSIPGSFFGIYAGYKLAQYWGL